MENEEIKTQYLQLLNSVEEKSRNITLESLQNNLMEIQEFVRTADQLHAKAKANKSTGVLLLDAQVNNRGSSIYSFS